jgi:hypothetical protein
MKRLIRKVVDFFFGEYLEEIRRIRLNLDILVRRSESGNLESVGPLSPIKGIKIFPSL